jgi:hypothetical protein
MIEAALFTRLASWAGLRQFSGDKVYPLRAPQNVPPPFITYQRISGPRVRSDHAGQHCRRDIAQTPDDGCDLQGALDWRINGRPRHPRRARPAGSGVGGICGLRSDGRVVKIIWVLLFNQPV